MCKRVNFSLRNVVGLGAGLTLLMFMLVACGENTALPTVTLASDVALVTTVTAESSATAPAITSPAVAPTVTPTITTGPLATVTVARDQANFTVSPAASKPLPSPTEQLVAPLKTPSGPVTREPPAVGSMVVLIGTVNSFDPGSGLLQLGLTEGKVVSVKVVAGTTLTRGGSSASLADIKSGMLVTATGSYNAQGQLEAVSIKLGLPAPPTVFNPVHIMTPVSNK